jgi:hypothetical protein
MNAKDALKKISTLLNLHFKRAEFASTSLVDGTEVTNNLDSDFQIGQVLYIVGDSTLTPAPAGTHETREGLKLTVDTDSVIIAIESADISTEGTTEVAMTEAVDAQGQTLESSTFDVGEPVYVIGADGSKSPASDGEHQVVLKDESGNENKIRIQVKDGIITERANVEEMSEVEVEEPMGDTAEAIKQILDVLLPMAEEMKALKDGMAKMKSTMSADVTALKSDFDKFKKSPERFSVVEKKTYKENMDDFKLDIIKSLRR